MTSKRRMLWVLFLLLTLSPLTLFSTPTTAQTSTSITVDGSKVGRRFDGVGGLSGGGGTSRLLIDYPAQQQSEILDYLFKPNYGASLQILKVEIGADADSTNGAEASSQRTPTDQNYQRGYEWWLMQQAKARNPNIKLYALEWAAPGWLNNSAGGTTGFWSQDNINYLMNWLTHAKSDYNLTIDYLGGWNERSYNATWYENLKSALTSHGFSTKIVAADDKWDVATALKNDSAFNSAVDIVGTHYPCGWNSGGTKGDTCNSSADAIGLGKTLWASENGTGDWNGGGAAIARVLNRDYIDGQMTASINWSLVAAWYKNLPFGGEGLLLANEPWSGHYAVGKSIWANAHTTQFVQPGWHFVNSAVGYLGGNRANGSYVAYKSTNNSDYSIVIETTEVTTSQTASFTITGGLSTGTVHVWATNFNSSSSSNWFIKQSDITPSSGKFSITLQPGYTYTLTTTTGQAKGSTTPPASAQLAIPYSDNFESYTVGQMPNIPKYFSTTMGAFEAENCGGGRTGKCMRQEITQAPIFWCCSGSDSRTYVGDPQWTDYTTSIDALLEQVGYVELYGHISSPKNNTTAAAVGYHLQLANTGSWKLYYADVTNTLTQLASGTVSYGTNKWTTLRLSFSGSTIIASIGGKQVANVTSSLSTVGQTGVAVSKWQNAQFDNFSVNASSSTATPTFVPPTTTTYDDSAANFVYTGSGWHHSTSSTGCYNNSNSWDSVTNEYMSVTFTGTQIKFYGVKDPKHGIGAISIDGGAETNIDFYAATRAGDQLLWTSPTLSSGTHTLKVRVTGTHNSSSTDFFIAPDRVDVIS